MLVRLDHVPVGVRKKWAGLASNGKPCSVCEFISQREETKDSKYSRPDRFLEDVYPSDRTRQMAGWALCRFTPSYPYSRID
jgi:hypothetical protein